MRHLWYYAFYKKIEKCQQLLFSLISDTIRFLFERVPNSCCFSIMNDNKNKNHCCHEGYICSNPELLFFFKSKLLGVRKVEPWDKASTALSGVLYLRKGQYDFFEYLRLQVKIIGYCFLGRPVSGYHVQTKRDVLCCDLCSNFTKFYYDSPQKISMSLECTIVHTDGTAIMTKTVTVNWCNSDSCTNAKELLSSHVIRQMNVNDIFLGNHDRSNISTETLKEITGLPPHIVNTILRL